MSIGPVKFGGIIAGRTIAPTAYINPLGDSSLLGWISNPANDWTATSIILGIVVAASFLWLLHGAVVFCSTNTATFFIASAIFLGMALLFVEGGKFNPFDLDQSMYAAILAAAYLSAGGRLFAQKEDKEGKKK